jgi:hypothetical protein
MSASPRWSPASVAPPCACMRRTGRTGTRGPRRAAATQASRTQRLPPACQRVSARGMHVARLHCMCGENCRKHPAAAAHRCERQQREDTCRRHCCPPWRVPEQSSTMVAWPRNRHCDRQINSPIFNEAQESVNVCSSRTSGYALGFHWYDRELESRVGKQMTAENLLLVELDRARGGCLCAGWAHRTVVRVLSVCLADKFLPLRCPTAVALMVVFLWVSADFHQPSSAELCSCAHVPAKNLTHG